MRRRATPPLLPPSSTGSGATCPQPHAQAPGDSRSPRLCPRHGPELLDCSPRWASGRGSPASTCACGGVGGRRRSR